MNRTQNIARKKHKDRISELEMEVALLKQKLEMVGNIIGGSLVKSSPFVDEKHGGVRPIATVWQADKDIFFQTNNGEDKEFLMKQIEIKKEGVSELATKDIEEQVKKEEEIKKEESIRDHMKR